MTENTGDETQGDDDLYVITLCTASLPMMLQVPFVHELEGFSVFRSHTTEAGRERFRLYVGYFDSATRAHEALPIVRKYYPTAWISCAPRKNLGSLDDTLTTAFGSVRLGTARIAAATARAAEAPRAMVSETEPSDAAAVAAAAPAAEQSQQYVVELDTSGTPVSPAAVPQLAVLRAYHLYNARFKRGHGVLYGLRLGFFKRVHGARQVAEYLKAYFPDARVVPVSQREYSRALALFEAQPPAASDAAGSGTTVQREPHTDSADPTDRDDSSLSRDPTRTYRS